MAFVTDSGVSHAGLFEDYKRALENDAGANTGGMGRTFAARPLLPFLARAQRDWPRQNFVAAALRGDAREALAFRGILTEGSLTAKGRLPARVQRPIPALALGPNCLKSLSAVAGALVTPDVVRFRVRVEWS